MAKKMTAIECVKKFLKSNKLEPMERTGLNEYVMNFFTKKITIIENTSKRDSLSMECNALRVRGISILRMRRICKDFCNEHMIVCTDNRGENVFFKFEGTIDSVDGVGSVLLELCDTIKCFVEELNMQMACNGVAMDTGKVNKEGQRPNESESKPVDEHSDNDLSMLFRDVVKGEGFAAVAGMDNLKRELRRDFVHTLLFKEIAKDYGILPPNGIMLYGPPGCGKTFLAERTAEEVGLRYALVKPSDLGSSLVHGSEGKIRSLFAEAEKNAPCLLIFDEFDALVPARDSRGIEHKAEEINEFLVHMNNCAAKGVYVIAMTNHPERIDRAILRKGRMDKCFYVPVPDEDTRAQIFELSLKKRLCSKNIDVRELAKLTDKYTSSDISYIVQETARKCFEKTLFGCTYNRKRISQSDLKETIETTMPSVTDTDVWAYDNVREQFDNKQITKQKRKTIGFCA